MATKEQIDAANELVRMGQEMGTEFDAMPRSPAGYESEHLQNVRRTLETGLKVAQHPPMEGGYIDLFTHALDELRRAGVEFPDS